jgi:hypothetical protein
VASDIHEADAAAEAQKGFEDAPSGPGRLETNREASEASFCFQEADR